MVETIEIFLEQQLMANKKTAWETLAANEVKVEVDKHRQTKGNLDYLSWAWAWGALKDKFPSATFEKHFFERQSAFYKKFVFQIWSVSCIQIYFLLHIV